MRPSNKKILTIVCILFLLVTIYFIPNKLIKSEKNVNHQVSETEDLTKKYENNFFSLDYPSSYQNTSEYNITYLSPNQKDSIKPNISIWPVDGDLGHGGPSACFIENTVSTNKKISLTNINGEKSICSSETGSSITYLLEIPNSDKKIQIWFEFKGLPDENFSDNTIKTLKLKI